MARKTRSAAASVSRGRNSADLELRTDRGCERGVQLDRVVGGELEAERAVVFLDVLGGCRAREGHRLHAHFLAPRTYASYTRWLMPTAGFRHVSQRPLLESYVKMAIAMPMA